MPESRSRLNKLNADTPHSQLVEGTQINHSTSEFFVCNCISKGQYLVNLNSCAQRYQCTVGAYDERFRFLRSRPIIPLPPKNHYINAYANTLTPAEDTGLSELHIDSAHGTISFPISANRRANLSAQRSEDDRRRR